MAGPEKCGYLVVAVFPTECTYGNGPREGETVNQFRVAATSERLREVVGGTINQYDLTDVDGHPPGLDSLPRHPGLYLFVVEDTSDDRVFCLDWLCRHDGEIFRRLTCAEAIAVSKGEALNDLVLYREWAGVHVGADER